MENTISKFEVSMVAPTRLKVLKKELSARKRRLMRAQMRQLFFS
jgi:hypothetical protein